MGLNASVNGALMPKDCIAVGKEIFSLVIAY
jgi:hypothetical protein